MKSKQSKQKAQDLSQLDRSKITGVVGIDCALLYNGVARIDSKYKPELTFCIETDSETLLFLRYQHIASEVIRVIKPTDVVLIEGYSFMSRGERIIQLAGIGEILRYIIWKKIGLVPFSIAPVQIKKFMSGSHKLQKEDVKLAAYKQFGREFKTTHEAEAYTLAKIGQVLFLPEAVVKYEYQKQVIAAIRKSHNIS